MYLYFFEFVQSSLLKIFLHLFFPQGKIVAQGRLLLQDTFMVSDQDGGLLSRMKERRVFLFEQIVIFSEPLDKKKGFSTPGYLFKNSIKVRPIKSQSGGKNLCHVSFMFNPLLFFMSFLL